ncbi:hypothetical protein PybrP1_008256 [[Pythium] brassicae (nom. inval.)]|nr:hypothetical protein PybrP1_008256 [[Pythium] brassicae (nom. inval.)]
MATQPEAPGDWEVRQDETSGVAFFYNVRTGEASWDVPATASVVGGHDDARSAAAGAEETEEDPLQWTEAFDESGRVYFVNLRTMETRWHLPPANDAAGERGGDGGGIAGSGATEGATPGENDEGERLTTAEQMEKLNRLLSGDDNDDEDGDGDGDGDGGDGDRAADSGEGDLPPPSNRTPSRNHGDPGASGALLLEMPWMMFLNESDGVPYYYNHLTGDCVWEPPAEFVAFHQSQRASEQQLQSRELLINHAEAGDAAAAAPCNERPASADADAELASARRAAALRETAAITPEFEEKVRRAIEAVSKTPVGSSRVLFVRTPSEKWSSPSASNNEQVPASGRSGSSARLGGAPSERRMNDDAATPLATPGRTNCAEVGADARQKASPPSFWRQLADPRANQIDELLSSLLDPTTFASTMRRERLLELQQRVCRLHGDIDRLDTQLEAIDMLLWSEESHLTPAEQQHRDATTAFQAKYASKLRRTQAQLLRCLTFWQTQIEEYTDEKRVAANDIGDDRAPTQSLYWRRVDQHFSKLCSSAARMDGCVLSSLRDANGDSLLHAAAWNGQLALVEKLLALRGVDVNAVDTTANLCRPLHEACRGGHVDVARLLVAAGASLDAVDAAGDSPLHIARMAALFHLRNRKKRRAIDLAKLPSLVAYLQQEIESELPLAVEPVKKTVSALRSAAVDWGFFYITNHGVSPEQFAAFQRAMRAFFALSKDVKNRIRRTGDNSRGYFDGELTKNKLDWKEVFDFAGRHEDGPPDDKVYLRMGRDQNQWLPEDVLPGFRATMRAYSDHMEHISRRLLMLFAVTLGERFDFFDQFYRRAADEGGEKEGLLNSSLLRLNYYPVAPDPEQTMGVYQHTDPGALTVLLQDDDVTSLQVFHRGSQQWLFVPPIKDTFVINIGDMVQVWSNDKFVAPLHRVLANGAKERFSAPFFHHPAYEAAIKPVIIADANEKPKYRSLTWRQFMTQRVAGNYVDLGEEIQISQFRIHEAQAA